MVKEKNFSYGEFILTKNFTLLGDLKNYKLFSSNLLQRRFVLDQQKLLINKKPRKDIGMNNLFCAYLTYNLDLGKMNLCLLLLNVERNQSAHTFPAGIYLLKVDNRNTRTGCEVPSTLTIKIQE